MKKSIYYLLFGAVLTVSCEKATELKVTSFQLEVTDYFTGDSMPNFPFRFSGVSNSSYNFNDTTNVYGRFDTIFTHQNETNFDCKPSSIMDYFIARTTGQLPGGTNTEVELELIPYAVFAYNFDCNAGNGFIQNVQRNFICPNTAESDIQNLASSQSQFISSPLCGNNMHRATIFSGTWVITYEKKSSSGSSWVAYADTVTVPPAADYFYTIAY